MSCHVDRMRIHSELVDAFATPLEWLSSTCFLLPFIFLLHSVHHFQDRICRQPRAANWKSSPVVGGLDPATFRLGRHDIDYSAGLFVTLFRGISFHIDSCAYLHCSSLSPHGTKSKPIGIPIANRFKLFCLVLSRFLRK